jgi:hypothetical protein
MSPLRDARGGARMTLVREDQTWSIAKAATATPAGLYIVNNMEREGYSR